MSKVGEEKEYSVSLKLGVTSTALERVDSRDRKVKVYSKYLVSYFRLVH